MSAPIIIHESELPVIDEFLSDDGSYSPYAGAHQATVAKIKSLPKELLVDLQQAFAWDGSEKGLWERHVSPDSAAAEPSEEPERWTPFWAAVIRGEETIPEFPSTATEWGQIDTGQRYATLRHLPSRVIVTIICDSEMDFLEARKVFRMRDGVKWVESVIPARYRSGGTRLTRNNIQPWAKGPIDEATQRSRILNHLCQWKTCLNSVLLYGPYNTSKTTFAAAFVTDIITLRAAEHEMPKHHDYRKKELHDYFDFHPCVWQINLNEWFDAYLAHRTRDFEDREKAQPSPTAEEIKRMSERIGLPPVLWIEELDKVAFSDTNRKWLHTLIDRIYQMDGCIVATTNMTHKQLVKELGEGIVGRIDGSRDDSDRFVCLNFAPPKKAKN